MFVQIAETRFDIQDVQRGFHSYTSKHILVGVTPKHEDFFESIRLLSITWHLSRETTPDSPMSLGATNLLSMSEESWSDKDDAMFQMVALPDFEPVKLTGVFCSALTADPPQIGDAHNLVTPESKDTWAKFSWIVRALQEPGLALSSLPRQHANARDVAFVWVMRDQDEFRIIDRPELVSLALIFTWIWRPDLGGWRLHRVDETDMSLEHLPRTSPDVAPDLRSVEPRR